MKQEIESLYKEKYKEFLRMAMRFTNKDEYLAEDIVQEAFTRAIEYEDSFNPDLGTLENWFKTILYMACIQHVNEERDRGIVRDVNERDIITEEEINKTGKTLSEIQRIVDTLKGVNKHICFLYFIRGYKAREIVAVTGAKSGTVRNYVNIFGNKLKEIYSGK